MKNAKIIRSTNKEHEKWERSAACIAVLSFCVFPAVTLFNSILIDVSTSHHRSSTLSQLLGGAENAGDSAGLIYTLIVTAAIIYLYAFVRHLFVGNPQRRYRSCESAELALFARCAITLAISFFATFDLLGKNYDELALVDSPRAEILTRAIITEAFYAILLALVMASAILYLAWDIILDPLLERKFTKRVSIEDIAKSLNY